MCKERVNLSQHYFKGQTLNEARPHLRRAGLNWGSCFLIIIEVNPFKDHHSCLAQWSPEYAEPANHPRSPLPVAPDGLSMALFAGYADLLSEARMIKREKQSTALIKLAGAHLPDFLR